MACIELFVSARGGTSNTSNSSGAASVLSTKTSSLGTFLVDANGRALYVWDADHGSKSTCSGACAQAWPPLTATATPKASGAVKASLLGTTKRADGSREVTYAGHPALHVRRRHPARPDHQAGQQRLRRPVVGHHAGRQSAAELAAEQSECSPHL